MSWAKNLANSQQCALNSLEFGSAFRPSTPSAEGLILGVTWFNMGKSNFHSMHSPSDSRLPAEAELEKLFLADMLEQEDAPFSYEGFEGGGVSNSFKDKPFYKPYSKTAALFSVEKGFALVDSGVKYIVIARDEAEAVVGFCVFSLKKYASNNWLYDEPMSGDGLNQAHEEARTLVLGVFVEDMYVLKAARRKGACSSILEYIKHVYSAELEHFGSQLEKSYRELEEFPFRVRTVVSANGTSQTVEIVRQKLIFKLEEVIEDFDVDHGVAAVPALEVLLIDDEELF